MSQYRQHLQSLSLSALLETWDRNYADWSRARSRRDWELEKVLREDMTATGEEMGRRSLEHHTEETPHHD